MTNEQRPFWKILMIASESVYENDLTCSECTALMDFLAEQVLEGKGFEELKDIALQFLNHCPDCTDHYLLHIKELEDKLDQIKPFKIL